LNVLNNRFFTFLNNNNKTPVNATGSYFYIGNSCYSQTRISSISTVLGSSM
jgi:hypothetical protein